MAKTDILLFVYGTLKRGYANNERCLSRATFACEAVTSTADYRMNDVGFPILSEVAEGGAKASGEIYFISRGTLNRCDQLEGHPYMYRREKREFKCEDGAELEAWVYLWQRCPDDGEPIEPDASGVLTWTGERRFQAQMKKGI